MTTSRAIERPPSTLIDLALEGVKRHNERAMSKRCAALALVSGLIGCGGCGGPPASIAITNPTEGAVVPLGTDMQKSVSASFSTTHFAVQATCSTSDCGQVYVYIDDAGCDPIGQGYNNNAVSSPATAHFAACATPPGAHALSVELHHQDGTPVAGANGQTASATVHITTQ
jgi:hypothetical protein